MDQHSKKMIIEQADRLILRIQHLINAHRDQSSILSNHLLPHKPQTCLDEKIQQELQAFAEKIQYICEKVPVKFLKEAQDIAAKQLITLKKQYGQHNEYLAAYTLPQLPKTVVVPLPPRQLQSTAKRLEQGMLHHQCRQALLAYWNTSVELWHSAERLWSSLTLSLIYFSGCTHEKNLQQILMKLNEELAYPRNHIIRRLYADAKQRMSPLVVHYRTENPNYGNDMHDGKLYQWHMTFFNPYAILFYQALRRLHRQTPQFMPNDPARQIKASIINLLKQLPVNSYHTTLIQRIAKLGFTAFEGVHFCLEFAVDLNIDLFMSSLLQQTVQTSALSSQDFEQSFTTVYTQNPDPAVLNIALSLVDAEQLAQVPVIESWHSKLKQIPFEITIFESGSTPRQKGIATQQAKKVRSTDQHVIQQWQTQLEHLNRQRAVVSSVEESLIEAQCRLLNWFLHLATKRKLKISTIENYASAFGKDFIFFVWINAINFDVLSTADYEQLYAEILQQRKQRDEHATQRDNKTTKRSKKTHFMAKNCFLRLKDFHQFCCEYYKAPKVFLLNQHHYQQMQICTSRLVSPQLFHHLLQALDQQQVNTATFSHEQHNALKLIYILSFRLGLRLNEVLMLRLKDINCPGLSLSKKVPIKAGLLTPLSITIQNHQYRRLKSSNAQRILLVNHLLSQAELGLFQEFFKQRYEQFLLQPKEVLLFAVGQQIFKDQSISQLTSQLFSQVIGHRDHGFSFHSLRHSAANHLAIALLGSNKFIKNYSDYSDPQIKHIKQAFFGTAALQYEAIIQDKWKAIAHWMGHQTIEQTANNYLHVLDMIIADRLNQGHYPVNRHALHMALGTDPSLNHDNSVVNLVTYIAKAAQFDCYHQNVPTALPSQFVQVSALKPVDYTPYQQLMRLKAELIYANSHTQHQHTVSIWAQRSEWLIQKISDPQAFNSTFATFCALKQTKDQFSTLHKRAIKQGFNDTFCPFIHSALAPQDFKNQNFEKLLHMLHILLIKAKLRRGFIHLQAKNEQDRQQVQAFIKLNQHYLNPDLIQLKIADLSSMAHRPEQIVSIAYINIKSQKNITRAVIFWFIVHMMQRDSLFLTS